MKIEMELKHEPRGKATVKIKIDQAVHNRVTVQDLITTSKREYPWVKIIDLRIDLR